MAWFSSEDQGSQSDSHVKNGRNHKKKAKIEKEKKREKYDEMNKNVHSWKNRKNAQPVHKNGNTSPPRCSLDLYRPPSSQKCFELVGSFGGPAQKQVGSDF